MYLRLNSRTLERQPNRMPHNCPFDHFSLNGERGSFESGPQNKSLKASNLAGGHFAGKPMPQWKRPPMSERMGKPRKSGKPTNATARKIGILLDLVRNRRMSLRACEQIYGASERTLLRDLQELRAIGASAGYRITEREHGDIFELAEFKSRPSSLLRGERRLSALLAELFSAFGEPVHDAAEELETTNRDEAQNVSFLHVVQPQLADGSAVAETYGDVEAAWLDNARIEFRYKGQLRCIEPASAVVRAGRYYLVGRDVAKGTKGWRTFSMELIEGPIRRAGSFTPRQPPSKYVSSDAVGFFKGDGEPQTVEVAFSENVAASAISRKWQRAQTIGKTAAGATTIRLQVDDVDEVIRWALGFGDEAWIVAPADAVARARLMAERIRRRYP